MHPRDSLAVSLRERLVLLVGGATWILLTGVLDYLTGVEYRIFPLYFLPICLVGWRLGYVSTIGVAWLSAATWLLSNELGGMTYSSPVVWVVNTITQGVSFTIVGVLVVVSRRAFILAEMRSRTDTLTGLLSSRAFSEEATRVTASIGAVTSRSAHPSIDTLLQQADALLYNAKTHGKDRVVLTVVGA